jgi:hypothetical protein
MADGIEGQRPDQDEANEQQEGDRPETAGRRRNGCTPSAPEPFCPARVGWLPALRDRAHRQAPETDTFTSIDLAIELIPPFVA